MPFLPPYRPSRAAALLLALAAATGAARPSYGQPGADSTPPPADEAPAPGPEREKLIRDLLRKGLAEYRRANYEAALNIFDEAWRLSRDMDIAATIADIEMKLGRWLSAAEHWEYYISNLPTDRAAAEAKLAECRTHLASVSIAVDTHGASVIVDDRLIGTAPLTKTVWLEPGPHTIYARNAERASQPQQLSLTAGQTATLTLRLPAPPPPRTAQPLPPLSPTPAPEAHRKPPLFVLLGGSALTAVALGTGIVFTLKANSAEDDTRNMRARIADDLNLEPDATGRGAYCQGPQSPAACNDLSERANDIDQFRNTATASFIAAGVFGVATAVSYFVWPGATPTTGGNSTLDVAFGLGTNPGVALSGNF